jgi:hypothetical protein
MAWRKKSGGDQSSACPSNYDAGEGEKVPRGHVPMVTCCGERVLVPVRLLAAPCIVELLDMAGQTYGYSQPGVLRITCDAGHFQRVIDDVLERAG